MENEFNGRFKTEKSNNYANASTNANTNESRSRYTCNTPFETLITLSYLFETRKSNEDRPKRTIRSFRSLSKQAKKEWLYKHRNASSFNWDDEYEM